MRTGSIEEDVVDGVDPRSRVYKLWKMSLSVLAYGRGRDGSTGDRQDLDQGEMDMDSRKRIDHFLFFSLLERVALVFWLDLSNSHRIAGYFDILQPTMDSVSSP